MQRITQALTKPAYVAYLTAGDGGINCTLTAALALIAGGVTVLEIGMPFSDPIADGPIIQHAATRALASGTTMADVLWLAREIRKHSNIPLILFSYLNPVLAADPVALLPQLAQAGFDGLLLVDCPLEESFAIRELCLQQQLALIYIITPTTPTARLHRINAQASGFLYYACRKGTTGIRDELPVDFNQQMQRLYDVIELPIVVGFGIANRAMAQKVLAAADGVVVGSKFVQAVHDGYSSAELTALAAELL